MLDRIFWTREERRADLEKRRIVAAARTAARSAAREAAKAPIRAENKRKHREMQAAWLAGLREAKAPLMAEKQARKDRAIAEKERKANERRDRRIAADRERIKELVRRPGVIVTVMEESDLAQLGPKMRALANDRQRSFVLAYVSMAKPNAARAYRMAYGTTAKTANASGANLLRQYAIKDALHEEAVNRIETGLLVKAVNVAERILDDPTHPKAATVAFAVMDRAGLHATSEHKVTVEHLNDDPQAVARVKAKLEALGIDPIPLLGHRLSTLMPAPTTTDAEYVEVPTEAAEYVEVPAEAAE